MGEPRVHTLVERQVIRVVLGVCSRPIVANAISDGADGTTAFVAVAASGAESHLIAKNTPDSGVVRSLVEPVVVRKEILERAVTTAVGSAELVVKLLLGSTQ